MADKKTIGIYKAYLKEHLSKKRYTHSMNVANSAVELAKRYGADADKAYIAGLLHDVAKEIPALELAAIVSKSSLDVCDIEKKATTGAFLQPGRPASTVPSACASWSICR